jgi:hypothetical protein
VKCVWNIVCNLDYTEHFFGLKFWSYVCLFLCLWLKSPVVGVGLLIFEVPWSHSFRHTTLGRTPLGEWSVRRRDLCLTTHNAHKRNIHASGGIRTHNPSKRLAEGPRLTRSGHWDGLWSYVWPINLMKQKEYRYVLSFKRSIKCPNNSSSIITYLQWTVT